MAFNGYEDITKKIDDKLSQLDKEIEKLNIEKEKLVQAKKLLLGKNGINTRSKVANKTTSFYISTDDKKEKIRQAAFLRHKKEREEKAGKITLLLQDKETMTTAEIAEAMNATATSIIKVLKEGDFQKVSRGVWALKNKPEQKLLDI